MNEIEWFVKCLVEGEMKNELNTFERRDKTVTLYARDRREMAMVDIPDGIAPVEIVTALHRIKSLTTDIKTEIEKLNKRSM